MFPLKDTIRSNTFPVVNTAIIALNLLIFVFEFTLGRQMDAFIREFGLTPVRFYWGLHHDLSDAILPIFTSMFLHGGWIHVLGNMWFLFIFGDNVEDRLGGLRYLIFYLLSGVAAALLQAYILSGSNAPMVGASGAIAGVLGAYLVLFPRARVASLVPILFIFTIVELPAIVFLLFWFVSQLFSGLFVLNGGSGSGVAWWAHIGGFAFGMVAGLLFTPRRRYPQVY